MKILIAEDEPVARRLLEGTLRRWGYEVVSTSCGREAAALLQAFDPPRLAVLDWMMPDLEGVDLCRQIRARGDDAYTYVILLTSKTAKSDVVAGLEAGADDYLAKPFEPQELRVRLDTGRRILELMRQLVDARERIRDLALCDGLTGLRNRGGILDLLEKEFERAKRQGSPIGLIMMDIDHFKSINDTYGHRTGDEALRTVGKTILGGIRPYDCAGRYGGEEFLIVLPGCNELNAAGHAERVRLSVEQAAIQSARGVLGITASFGVTSIDPADDRSIERWIEAADEALYQAKREGRNQVRLAALRGIDDAADLAAAR
jgi:diguanylate cyclase (GGDEF)-like protein